MGWTKQFDTTKEVEAMPEERLEQAMREAFDMEMKPNENGEVDIDVDEFNKCAKIVLAGIDTHTDEGVQQDEYVHAACRQINSFGDSRIMLKFFDENRRRWPA